MERWQHVWREGFVPILPLRGLLALRAALIHDDPQLIQGGTTYPPPLTQFEDHTVEGACGVGLCGWFGEQCSTVGAVEECFARYCHEADQRLGEPAASRWFLNWFDDTPRSGMRRELLAEIERALQAEKLIINQQFEGTSRACGGGPATGTAGPGDTV